jgi:CO/xanthine dehydrogenase Mo-binding subunit
MSAAIEKPVVLPGGLNTNRLLSQWLQFLPDGRVRLLSGKVEIGQGILHALAQIAAQELAVDVRWIEAVAASTAFSPNEAVTSGSLSIQDSGIAVRLASRHARLLFTRAAAEHAGVPVQDMDVTNGQFIQAGRVLGSYADLCHRVDLALEVLPASQLPAGPMTRVASPIRPDLVRKFFASPDYLQDLELPGMLHARMLRPPNLQSRLNEEAWLQAQGHVQALNGVQGVYREGCQIGVIASTEAQAIQAVEALALQLTQLGAWHVPAEFPNAAELSNWLRQSPLQTTTVASAGPAPDLAQSPAVRSLQADYARGYLHHASMAPSCALAQWLGDGVQVWSHSQGIFNLRRDMALALGCVPEQVTIAHVQGAGCYGHNGADDVAFDAAWLARFADGSPVRVLWSRHDEMAWSPLGPAMSIRLQAGLDAQDRVVFWQHDVWSQGHGTRPGRNPTPALLGCWLQHGKFPVLLAENAALAVGGGSDRNAVPPYAFDSSHIFNHRVMQMPMRVSALRGLGAHANVFAAESFMDEVAHATGQDPLSLRLNHLADPRGRAVLEKVVEQARWTQRQARQQAHAALGDDTAWGQGLAYARYKNTGAYCAMVAEVEVGEQVRVKRLYIVADVGHVVDADGAINQLEGGAIQAASWTLMEAARFDRQQILSVDWENYPIFRFEDVPEVSVDLVGDSSHPSVGAGEATIGPCAAAIGNAVFHALGVRVRDMPITPEQILTSMNQADTA